MLHRYLTAWRSDSIGIGLFPSTESIFTMNEKQLTNEKAPHQVQNPCYLSLQESGELDLLIQWAPCSCQPQLRESHVCSSLSEPLVQSQHLGIRQKGGAISFYYNHPKLQWKHIQLSRLSFLAQMLGAYLSGSVWGRGSLLLCLMQADSRTKHSFCKYEV